MHPVRDQRLRLRANADKDLHHAEHQIDHRTHQRHLAYLAVTLVQRVFSPGFAHDVINFRNGTLTRYQQGHSGE